MNRIRAFVSDSDLVQPLGYRLLASPPLNANRLYRALYSRRIRTVQAARAAAFPRVVAVEGTNRCNAACVMCGHRNMTRPQGVMEWPLYEGIIAQSSSWPVELLLLSGFGEPLCDPDLVKRVAAAKAAGIRMTGIVTNAALLDGATAKELTAAGLGLIHVSLDGASPETYNRLRGSLDFNAVAANLDALVRMKPRPAVHIQMVLFKSNRRDADRIRRRWGGKADRIIFRQAQDWAGQVDIPETGYTPHTETHRSWPPCRYLWDQLNIYWDGAAPACCLDYEARQTVGNAAKQTLRDIWQGGALAEIRRKHKAGERDSAALCRQCRYFSIWW
ncbi:MAG: radical SAM/SPASM domain-containing protein [Candidatus Edwardsbacteria bacterium]|nr:radical SAM/SPASM domain-containing protein [Candidatus Edwardsbacteria bacterium]